MSKLNELVITRRGEYFDAPEDTFANINLVRQRNIKSAEVDIHLTKEYEIVVIHDDDK